MKLRIRGSSLRLRLSQGEIRTLRERGAVEDAIAFPGGGRLTYRLGLDDKSNEISASYGNNVIEIRIPSREATDWCDSDLVGLTATQSSAAGELHLAVEKDFACLAPREGEDESDNFPHPQAGSGKTC